MVTEVIKELKRNNISALYVYDALYVPSKYGESVKVIMDTICRDAGIKTWTS